MCSDQRWFPSALTILLCRMGGGLWEDPDFRALLHCSGTLGACMGAAEFKQVPACHNETEYKQMNGTLNGHITCASLRFRLSGAVR
ncbi:hypothetical protein DENSPDRAFT_632360 [Dentipellis sp. KUC8613]|nr:hypothetical protein DENSPDRAFT_632360 [Dentipellis sp. KUC8613]